MSRSGEVTVKVRRYGADGRPEWVEYQVRADGAMNVLNLLEYIHLNVDPLVAFRSSCQRGVCGGCAMTINGRRRLACQTAVEDGMEIDPLGESDG